VTGNAFSGGSFTGTTVTTSGNVKLGDTTSDSHTITGSLGVSGSFSVNGDVTIGQAKYGTYISSSIGIGNTAIVAAIPTGSYNGVFFDYTIAISTTGRRVGTTIATWLPGTSTVEFTDYSTLDIGTTSGVTMEVDINSGNIRLKANNQSLSVTEVRAITRVI
jgi:hypothetical protein